MTGKRVFGKNSGAGNMFLASLFLHLMVIAAVFATVPGSSKQLTFGAPYSVALVGPDVLESSKEDVPKPKDLLQSGASTGPVILKRDIGASPSSFVMKKDDSGKPDIEKAIRALEQKETAAGQSKDSPAASTSPIAAAANSSQLNEYSRHVWSKVKRNWSLPAALMPKNNVEAVIEVRIAKSGAVEHIGFEKRSGNSYFDESALRAVKKSTPFPPLGGWTSGRTVEIGIRFHSAELR
ncbi:MAG TPA: energy transducer TonB [Smithellaceae bacterium]|nr:TonB C-terminal domain-containing protein [Smithella sp.]HNY95320.1 energy transducer TonB [Smithellaceae bacterium]HOD63528.1 energy transducer TonB [Smithellaceae bacterium]HOE22508.1 energy transducer TonB [Smithellaceae bacterium]HOH56206.1 energy transducer TonB [Smithellaceae bacterium]